MRIVVFSDIHGNKYSFESFLESLETLRYDRIIFCGDVFGYYYYADEIIHQMISNNIICLLGNHDKMLLDILDNRYSEEKINFLCTKYGSVYQDPKSAISQESLSHLRSLSSAITIQDKGLKLGFFHGTPDDPLNGRLYPDTDITVADKYNEYDYVFLGHTHHRMERRINNTTIINPGSLGQQRDGKGCSYLVFDTDTVQYELQTVNYNIDKLVNDINRYDPGNKYLSEVLYRKGK